MSQKEQLATWAESIVDAAVDIRQTPADVAQVAADKLEAAFLLGARARDRQLLDEFRFHLPFDAAKIEGIMRVTKPEELLSEPRSVRV